MLKKYYIKYKLESIPTYWEFTCYEDNDTEALSAFILNVEMSRVEDYYIAYVERV